MKRKYVDLHLRLDLDDLQKARCMIDKAAELGYCLVGISLQSSFSEEKKRLLKDMCREAGIDFVSRVDLKLKTPRELLSSLRSVRRRFEIVAVMCESKNVARQAAKDRRVDLLNFPSTEFYRRFFDKPEAELASNSLSALEMDLKPLLMLEGVPRIRLLANLRKEVAIAQDFHVPIVVSSGVNDEMLMRKPLDMAALASLFILDQTSALDAVSGNPAAIVERNRAKLSPKFVAPGIRVIREGKDW
jgi:RNase P/RNase MRP subunit p30